MFFGKGDSFNSSLIHGTYRRLGATPTGRLSLAASRLAAARLAAAQAGLQTRKQTRTAAARLAALRLAAGGFAGSWLDRFASSRLTAGGLAAARFAAAQAGLQTCKQTRTAARITTALRFATSGLTGGRLSCFTSGRLTTGRLAAALVTQTCLRRRGADQDGNRTQSQHRQKHTAVHGRLLDRKNQMGVPTQNSTTGNSGVSLGFAIDEQTVRFLTRQPTSAKSRRLRSRS